MNWVKRKWNDWWYAYTPWNGIIGPGGQRRRYFRRERIWHTLLIIWAVIMTLLSIF